MSNKSNRHTISGPGGGDGDSDKKHRRRRVALERTISTNSEIPMTQRQIMPREGSPGFMHSLWRKNKNKDNANHDQNVIIDDVDEEESSGEFTMMKDASPPVDGTMNGLFESMSFDEPSVSEDALRVKIVKEQLRVNLLELMRSHGGNVRALEDIEAGVATPETLTATLGKEASQFEKNVAFLWCAFLRRPELLKTLQTLGADVDFCEPLEGFSALHLAAFSGCTACVRSLLAMNVSVNAAQRNYTPLHSAAFGNSVAAAQLLINSGARTDLVGCSGDGVCGAAIHSAIRADAVECVHLLVKYCADINSIEPTGASPLHVAADLGHVNCVNAILQAPGVDVDVKTRDKKNTALHLAAEAGNVDCVATLLAKGADAEARNAKGQTPLHLACKTQAVECVETLLKTAGAAPNATDADARTPLHCAVGRPLLAFELAEILIAWRADVNVADRFGYTPLHIAALNELSQCVETLLRHDADVTARTKGGVTALGIIVRKTPASLAVFYDNLDRAISMHDPDNSSREVELKLDFRKILQHCGRGEISFLNTFVDEGQKEILEHPLCEAFLHLKWEKIRKYYLWRLVFCGLFVLCLTGYVMTALAHNCYNEGVNATTTAVAASMTTVSSTPEPFVVNTRFAIDQDARTMKNNANDKNASADSKKLCDNAFGRFIKSHTDVVEVQWYVLIVFTFAEMFRKFYGLAGYVTWRQYFSQLENLGEWFVIVSVFAISCVFTRQTYSWQNHVAAFAVLSAWSNLMFMIGQLPSLGSYVAMFTKVQKEFAKLLLAYVCLLVGFTISFCVIFPASVEFANPMIGFINILVMMTGEVGVDLLTGADDNVANINWLYVSAHLIYILFLLLVTIVLMNLLVGIAVNDIQGLKKTAGLSKLVRQTQLINYIERAMFNHLLPQCFVKVLSLSALVSPSAYRVVLQVKPLNPRERRLPKDILKSAYELAKSVRQGAVSSRGPSNAASIPSYGGTRQRNTFQPKKSFVRKFGKQVSEVETLQTEVEEGAMALARLTGEVQVMRQMLEGNQAMLARNQAVIERLVEMLGEKACT